MATPARLPTVATLSSVSAASIGYWCWHRRAPATTPPGTVAAPLAWAGADNIPILGILTRLHSVITDPVGLVLRNREHYGDVFTLRVPSIYDFTFVLSSEGYATVMSLPTDHAGIGEVLSRVPTVGYWFPRSGTGPESLQRLILAGRRLMAELLPAERVQSLVDRVPSIVAGHIATWERDVDLTEVIHPVVYEVVGRYFLGDRVWDTLGERLTRYYRRIADGIDIPRTTMSVTPAQYLMREYRATRRLYRLLRDELADVDGDDSPLLNAIDDLRLDGEPLSGPDRLWMIMYVMWNATNYPGSYTFWTLVDVVTKPGILQRVRALETREERLDFLGRCLSESVRLHPVSSLIRYLDKPLELQHQGQTIHIPAGQAVGAFPGTLNRDPQRVACPDHYDPDRYRREPTPKTASFGRGAFGCIAQRFSERVTATVVDELLQRYDISLLGPLPVRRERVHQTYPASPLPARLRHRHHLDEERIYAVD